MLASGHNSLMGEHDKRKSEDREQQEAAVLPADKAVSIITSGRERTDDEESAEGKRS